MNQLIQSRYGAFDYEIPGMKRVVVQDIMYSMIMVP